MSTETRIGIVAGLLIVVIASVYFFYGASRREDDILVAATPKPAALKIPISNEKPPTVGKPRPLVQNPPRSQPVRPAQVASAPPIKSAGPMSATPKSDSMGIVGPPADRISTLTGIDKYKWSVPLAPPLPAANSVAHTANTPPPTYLRTSPSPGLVESTQGNLDADPKSSLPVFDKKTATVDSQIGRVKIEPETITKPAGTQSEELGIWPKHHIVGKGDTLASLSKQYYQDGKKSSEIVAANPGLKGRRKLKAGETIMIPQPAAAPELHATGLELTPASSDRTYTVKEGDTIYGIAKKNLGDSNRWKDVFELNKDQLRGDPRRLKPGMTLKLPT